MAFIYKNVTPLAIRYAGTDLTAVKYGNTTVWAKPYSLSITTDDNMDVSITRTSSLYPEATIGLLVDSSIIYDGDEILLEFTPKSDYKIKTATINGISTHSGATVTVTEPLDIVLQAEESHTWHTLMTGNYSITSNTTLSNNAPVAIIYSLTLTATNEEWSYQYNQIIELGLGETKDVYGQFEDIVDVHTEKCGTITLSGSQNGPKVVLSANFSGRTGELSHSPYTLVMTKLRAYY